ncbi:GGDEF family protein [Vibrio sp. JCM 19236]|nr:GGDEF family protein [Vibrio sp. JCM 19236]
MLLTSHYERVIHHVSQNQLEATTSNLRSSLNLFLKQPFDASFSLAYTIKGSQLYKPGDVSAIQDYIHTSFDELYSRIDHLDVIGFGGKNGEFVGYRRNDQDNYSLMLKDQRTQNNLVIFMGEETESGATQVTPNYDPRTRPWYNKFNTPDSWKPRWSPIYVNSDEKQETTLSALQPLVLDNELLGVLVADIKLDTFNQFLVESRRLTHSHFFIFDDNIG